MEKFLKRRYKNGQNNKTITSNKSKIGTRYMAGVAMLSALAFVLQYLEFPIPDNARFCEI